ncbi:MAG: hypothetical protein JXB39_01300, partial [Deltaproteobacteria bacterium]|nr:hypothetical protein [Deltaproteobacteria bacterium]
ADTDADADVDCDLDDLVFSVEMRSPDGTACEACSSRVSLSIASLIANPCEEDLVFTTTDSCLVSSWEIIDDSGMGMGMGVICSPTITDWDIPAGDWIEDVTKWGPLSHGSYVVTVTFDDEASTTASSRFTVK